jgi:hypothetical protein
MSEQVKIFSQRILGYYKKFEDGEPCDHRRCLHHTSHPCESCGRIAGYDVFGMKKEIEKLQAENKKLKDDLVNIGKDVFSILRTATLSFRNRETLEQILRSTKGLEG